MPSTTELIDYMALQAEGWNRTGNRSLLEALNQAQDILYKQKSHQAIAYRTDGKLPYITTTDSTYDYTLNQATTGLSDDIWRVDSVLVKPPFSNQLLAAIRVEYAITPNLRQPTHPMEINGNEYFRFFQVNTIDGARGTHPKLRFTVNPGATTTDFYLLAYLRPTELTSENVQPTLPEHVHFTHLLPAAMKLVEAYQNGNLIEALKYIKEEVAPEVQSELNDGDQGQSHSITRFEE